VSVFLRLQNPALGPFRIKARVHLEIPRRESCLCQAAVSRVARESTNAALVVYVVNDRMVFFIFSIQTHLSHRRTPLPDLRKLSDSDARMALGSTYKAISPRLLPCSIHILEPQTRLPANAHPNGPSQKSWGIQGINRASTSVLVVQTAIHIDDTNVERNEALRSTEMSVSTTLEASRSL
jgi:hypothetical protein